MHCFKHSTCSGSDGGLGLCLVPSNDLGIIGSFFASLSPINNVVCNLNTCQYTSNTFERWSEQSKYLTWHCIVFVRRDMDAHQFWTTQKHGFFICRDRTPTRWNQLSYIEKIETFTATEPLWQTLLPKIFSPRRHSGYKCFCVASLRPLGLIPQNTNLFLFLISGFSAPLR